MSPHALARRSIPLGIVALVALADVACVSGDGGASSPSDAADSGTFLFDAGDDAASTSDASDAMPSDATPATNDVTTYDAPAGILFNEGVPGFFDPEIYTKTVDGEVQYWIRDKVTSSTDPRTRHYYVDYGYVGASLDFGPIHRGGVYEVRCLRFSDLWWQHPDIESHVVWFRVPGPMMEPGEVQVPKSFQIGDSWAERHTKLLPSIAPISGKLNPVYRLNLADAASDLYAHGATHVFGPGSGENDPTKQIQTTGVYVASSWMDSLGVSDVEHLVDHLGEGGFRRMSDAQMDDAIAQQPPIGLFLTDLEKTATGWGDPSYWWSIPLEDATLPRYFRFLKGMHDAVPGRLVGDYYRPLVWSKGFPSPDDGNPHPEHPRWAGGVSAPETHVTPAYRSFVGDDGNPHSLREVASLYVVDAYPARGHGPFDGDPTQSDRSWSVYQIYSMIYDTLIHRRALPASAKVLWFGWIQSDNDQPTRVYLREPDGRASYMVRNPIPAWWAQTVEMLGYIVADGTHWWSDQWNRGDDPTKLMEGDGAPLWEPTTPGAPAPWTWDANPAAEGSYPRFHFYPITYGKLGQYQLALVDSTLSHWELASYSTDDGATFAPNGDDAILELATRRLPIVIVLGKPGDRAIFAVHPFGDFRKRYALKVSLDGVDTIVTVTGKWPTIVRR